MTNEQARHELRKLLDRFVVSSRSQLIRVELSDTIVACYTTGVIDRAEYHDLMAEVA